MLKIARNLKAYFVNQLKKFMRNANNPAVITCAQKEPKCMTGIMKPANS